MTKRIRLVINNGGGGEQSPPSQPSEPEASAEPPRSKIRRLCDQWELAHATREMMLVRSRTLTGAAYDKADRKIDECDAEMRRVIRRLSQETPDSEDDAESVVRLLIATRQDQEGGDYQYLEPSDQMGPLDALQRWFIGRSLDRLRKRGRD